MKNFIRNRRIYNAYTAPIKHVQNNLALTPSDCLAMSNQGIPIASQLSESNFYDGDNSPSLFIGLENTRGIDAVDLWEHDQRYKSMSKNLYSTD